MARYPDDFTVSARKPEEEAMIEELATLEKIVTLANEEEWINVREAARLEGELTTLRSKAAAWDARQEVRAALRRALPDLAFASRFAAPDNPISGGTLAARLDRRGVHAVLAFIGEREAGDEH